MAQNISSQPQPSRAFVRIIFALALIVTFILLLGVYISAKLETLVCMEVHSAYVCVLPKYDEYVIDVTVEDAKHDAGWPSETFSLNSIAPGMPFGG